MCRPIVARSGHEYKCSGTSYTLHHAKDFWCRLQPQCCTYVPTEGKGRGDTIKKLIERAKRKQWKIVEMGSGRVGTDGVSMAKYLTSTAQREYVTHMCSNDSPDYGQIKSRSEGKDEGGEGALT